MSLFLRRLPSLVLLAPAVALAVAWSGVGHANAPPGRYTILSGTVYDTKTKLTWQQAVAPGTYAWANAKTYCTSLSLNGAGWRLPSAGELQTIVDETRTNPSIDPMAFPGTPPSWFWVSSPVAGVPSGAWAVEFNVGVTDTLLAAGANQVRCVR